MLEIRRFVSRSVERRDFLHLRRVLFLRNKFLSETREPAQAFGLRAAAQESALEIQVVDGFGELKTDGRMLGIGLGAGKLAAHVREGVAKFTESAHRLLAKIIRWRRPIIIVEEFDFASQPGEFLIERDDLKTAAAAGNHIESSIWIAIENLLDDNGAAGIHDAIATRENDAKFGSITLGFTHHFLVTFFENVKWHRASGEGYQLQREER